MIFGNAAWGLRETPLEDQLRLTAAMGLELLELSIAGYDRDFLQLDADEKRIGEVRKLFERYGIRPDCAATGNDFTNDDVATQVANVRRVIDIAAAVGAKYLRIFAGFNSDSVVYGARFERMLEALRKVAAYAAERSIVPVVETHGGVAADRGALIHFASVTTRSDTLREILKTGVSLNYDPANLAAVGMADAVGFYELFRKEIRYVHLKDFRDVPGGVVPAACGEGRLDWPRLMRTLSGYDGPALIEYELPEDVEDGLRRSLDYLRKMQA